ncbi:MAG: chromosome segregation protein SMC [Phototrophicales bacterium]|nr:MAG: chromosome segregation protein SMC [Phototrophicales bacterium]
MRFSRIRLENWRNFGTVNVELQNRAFLVGANASGKSNFLDAFRFLRDIVVPGGGFIDAVERRGGVSRLRNLAARRNPDIVLEVDLTEDEKISWRYRIAFGQDKNRRPILKAEKVWNQEGRLILSRPDDDDEHDRERLRQTYLEQVFANKDFREIKQFFESVHYSHLVPQLIRDPDRWTGKQSDPFGEDFLERIASVTERSQRARLRRIEEVLKIAIPQLSNLSLERDERGIPHLRGNYRHWRPTGAWQNEADFSDGTLRLIGLLWALQEGSGPLLLEEPELSLHPGVVRYLPQLIQQVHRLAKVSARQLFVSTHSYEMLQDEGIGADEVLLFITSDEGTTIKRGADDSEILQELDSGFTMAEAVMSRTEPTGIRQLALPLKER